MFRRLLPTTFLALCLVLSSIASLVADTRMAVAGETCGAGSPSILLDAAGLPVLDADGAAVEAPDCASCHLLAGFALPSLSGPAAPLIPARVGSVLSHPVPVAVSLHMGGHGRGPPATA